MIKMTFGQEANQFYHVELQEFPTHDSYPDFWNEHWGSGRSPSEAGRQQPLVLSGLLPRKQMA